MRENICASFVLVAAVGWSLPISSQDLKPARPVGTVRPSKVVRLPYTAEFRITRVQTLADGTTITHEATEVTARDSQGRTMSSSSSTSPTGDQAVQTNVNINDPVAR